MLRLKSLIALLLILWFTPIFSQGITGTVIDQNKEPVPGAYVYIKNDEHHTHTNTFGQFVIDEAIVGDTLIVTHVGFKTYSTGIISLSNLNIRLEEQLIELTNVTVTPSLDAINLFSKVDLAINPVNSSQEVLRKIPGLILGQHAGGGKAEQIFLRGFDIDHGTDIDITVDGMPVNMVSHAHGQGYADLHFVIPETIEKIDFGKGPYYADHGNFTTAGYVAFNTKERLKKSSVGLEYGSFDTRRLVSLLNFLDKEDESAYLATEYTSSDGPFESPQNFHRINLMAKYRRKVNNGEMGFIVSHFSSEWDASGQIPQRLVDNGTISRFGAVDDTEGGATGRNNIKFDFTKNLSSDSYLKNAIYFTKYDFELYSNFTFFLEDPVNGDQIRQKESRQIFGASSEWGKFLDDSKLKGLLKAGIGFRNDQNSDVELSKTLNRTTTLDTVQIGDVFESNFYGYLSGEFEFDHWVINPEVRVDVFDFQYNDFITPLYDPQSEQEFIVSPKLNVLYNQSENLQWYLKTGIGFHSNDSRVVVAQNGQEILPKAYGADIGAIFKPTPKILINTALWTLRLDQEFVYVGDAGIVEPSGQTQRNGIDFGIRYEALKKLFIYSDINYAHARSTEDPEGDDFIPLAPSLTATGGINFVNVKKLSGGLKFRHIADRPANEDNSIVADGYTIFDFNVNYTFGNLTLDLAVMNLFDQKWNEAQFATESRLRNEPSSVEEIHFTPGVPLSMRTSLKYNF